MAFSAVGMIGPNLQNVDTTAQFRVGTRVKGMDPTFGDGEFIYMKGIGSLVAGDVVAYDEFYTTGRMVSATRGPVAVAMSAALLNQFGWFQVQGVAVVSVLAAFAANAACYLTGTAGNIDDAVVAGQKIDGMWSHSAIDTPTTGKAYVEMAYSAANGNG